MLVLLLGPSGAGKTSIIEQLDQHYEWKAITSYITRSARPKEKYKVCLTEQEYRKKLEAGYFFSHIEQFGYMYGTSKAEVNHAISSKELWALDFDTSNYRDIFNKVSHQTIIILPQNEEQLRNQLISAGRSDRIEKSIEHFVQLMNFQSLHSLGLGNSITIINRSNDLAQVTAEIDNRIRSIVFK